MKQILLFLLLFLPAVTGTAQITSDHYVAASNGLNLRETADASGKVLVKVPFGVKLKLEPDGSVPYTAEGIKGYWCRTTYEGKAGYVFNGFLLPLPPPTEQNLEDYLSHYFTKMAGPLDFKPTGVSGEMDMMERSELAIYEKGILLRKYSGYEYGSTTVHIPWISLQQAFVFCRLIGDFKMFMSTDEAYPLKPISSDSKKVIHLRAGCDPGSYLEGIRIEVSNEAYYFLQIRMSEGGVEISTGGGV